MVMHDGAMGMPTGMDGDESMFRAFFGVVKLTLRAFWRLPHHASTCLMRTQRSTSCDQKEIMESTKVSTFDPLCQHFGIFRHTVHVMLLHKQQCSCAKRVLEPHACD